MAVAFSPDGKILASGSVDHTVRLWDPAAGRERRTLKGHTQEVVAVAFSPDGGALASGGGYDAVRLCGMVLAGPAAARLLAAQRIVQLAATSRQAQLPLVGGDRQLQARDGRHRREASIQGSIGPGLGSRLPEANGCVEAGVVGDRQRRHAQLRGPPDQLLRVADPSRKLKFEWACSSQ